MAIAFVHPREGLTPSPGAKLYFYDPGTTTERNVYQDNELTSLHMQPVIADSAGVWPAIYLQTGVYKVRDETALNVLIYEQDNVDPGISTGAGALPVSSGGTGATNATSARSNLAAASTTDLTTAQNAITAIQSQIDASLLAGDTRLGLMAGRDTIRAVDLDDTDFGYIIAQRSVTKLIGGGSTVGIIPADNTIPQSGEGTELFSLTITPKFTDSTIICKLIAACGTNGNVTTFALFDGSTDALQSAPTQGATSTLQHVTLYHEIPSWGTGAKTISIRWGSNAGTSIINQISLGPINFGGSITTYFEVIEMKGGPF
jgi:hypothetical protein